MKIETKKELKDILKLLNARDEESQILGYGLFQHSKFRKFIRNKTWNLNSDSKSPTCKFCLFPLDPSNFHNSYRTNSDRIIKAKLYINYYLAGRIKFYNEKGTQVKPTRT